MDPTMPEPSAVPAAGPRPSWASRVYMVLVACYAGFGALYWAYMFYVSTLPVTVPDDFGASAPGWMTGPAAIATLLLLPWFVCPLPLGICGAAHLNRVRLTSPFAPGTSAWRTAWVGAAAVAVGLEELWGWALPDAASGAWVGYYSYTGPGIVGWRALGLAWAFVILGVVMIAVLGGAERSARRLWGDWPAP